MALAQHAPSKSFGHADLRLNGLKTISAKAAEALAAHQGKVLLYSLEKLDSVPLAQKLERQWGEVRLGVTDLSLPIAAELAKRRGNEEDKTWLGVVARRMDGAASVLRLDKITSLSPETAEALAAHKGCSCSTTSPYSLQPSPPRSPNASATSKPGAMARSCSTGGRPFRPSPPPRSPPSQVNSFVLKAIPELKPDTAAARAKLQGRLHLTGLTKLSPEMHPALQSHKNLLLPRPLPLTA